MWCLKMKRICYFLLTTRALADVGLNKITSNKAEKKGLCLTLSAKICKLPLAVQLFSLNTVIHFSDSFGYRFTSPELENSESCPLFKSLLTHGTPSSTLTHGTPSYLLRCDKRMFLLPSKMCPSSEVLSNSSIYCNVPEFLERGETERRWYFLPIEFIRIKINFLPAHCTNPKH